MKIVLLISALYKFYYIIYYIIGQLETRHVTARKFQYTRGSLLLKQTRETDLPVELAPSYKTSLIWGSKTREQKFCCTTYFFARNCWCRRGSFTPGACYRSVLREQAPSRVPAFTPFWRCLVKLFETFYSKRMERQTTSSIAGQTSLHKSLSLQEEKAQIPIKPTVP